VEQNFKMSFPVQFGKYVLIDEIAVGGMAEIFKAVAHGTDGKQYLLAIKRVLPQYSSDEEFISMMIDEAKVMVLLNHPNIVPIVEFGKVEGSYYIAMEYVHGVSLKDLFRKVKSQKQSFSIDLAVHIVREIGSGLAYAHRKEDETGQPLGIVHRDISPANILLSYEGEVKIADFGISKASNQSHRTQIGIIRGKTGYMSPEQTRANTQLDQRSDIFSLGVILYELLTAERLFQAETVPEALKLVREATIPPIRVLRPDVPVELEQLMLKALAKEPEQRFARTELFVDALNEFLGKWTPQGRPIRVNYNHLVGFLRRFYQSDMDAAALPNPNTFSLGDMWAPLDSTTLAQTTAGRDSSNPETITQTAATRPQTFAANPLYELSSPERSLSEVATTVSSAAGATEVTRGGSLNQSITGKVRLFTRGKERQLLIAAGVAVMMSMLLWMWVRPKVKSAVTDGSSSAHSTPVATGTTIPEDDGLLSIPLATEPAGAKVFLNGKELSGATPLLIPNLKPKVKYSVRITKRGYKSKESTIVRSEGDESGITYFLNRIDAGEPPPPPKVGPPVQLGPKLKYGKLSVNSTPWSTLYIDGRKVGDTPVMQYAVTAGVHKIRFVQNSKMAREFPVLIKAGDETKCTFNFADKEPKCRK
jgi:serine/threonine protein kinase